MKKGFLFLAVISTVLFSMSCDDDLTYTDMLEREEKAIDRLIDTLLIEGKNIEVLSDFPADSVFAPHQFVILENEVYLNIIKKGSDVRAEEYKTNVYARFKTRGLVRDTTLLNTLDNSMNVPGSKFTSFVYGNYYNFPQQSNEYGFIGEGVNDALRYVGDGGRVKLIVPFNAGSPSDRSQNETRYFMDLRFQFD
jgi:hypothetical protein